MGGLPYTIIINEVNMKKIISFAIVVFGIVGLSFAQSNLQPIAEVTLSKRTPITLGQLKNRVQAYENEGGRKLSPAERQQLLDGLINETLFYQAAEREGIRVSDAQVNAAFGNLIAGQIGREISEAEFAKFIREKTGLSLDDFMKQQNGMNVQQYKAFLKNQLTAQAYVGKLRGSDLQNISGPTDQEIRAEYDLNKQSLVRPDTVKLFLVGVQKSDPNAKKQIGKLRVQILENPSSIEQVRNSAKTAKPIFFADDIYVSKTKLAADQLGVPMDTVLKIFKMKKNEVSDISETADTYQCFMLREKIDAKILGLSDEVQPGSAVTVYEYLKKMLLQQKQQEALASAIADLTNDLRKPENFKILKSDEELKRLLSW